MPVEILDITLNDGVEVFQTPLHGGGPGFEYIDTVFASDVKAMLCKHRVGSFAKKVYGDEMEPGEFFLFPWGDLTLNCIRQRYILLNLKPIHAENER